MNKRGLLFTRPAFSSVPSSLQRSLQHNKYSPPSKSYPLFRVSFLYINSLLFLSFLFLSPRPLSFSLFPFSRHIFLSRSLNILSFSHFLSSFLLPHLRRSNIICSKEERHIVSSCFYAVDDHSRVVLMVISLRGCGCRDL